jgi:sterol desaturase/sphingolipid hydroxylase (fatty acid hydroxylase superfamily)
MDPFLIRIAPFALVLGLVLVWEALAAARPSASPRFRQVRVWSALALMVLGTVLTRLALPVGLAGLAAWAGTHGTGLFTLVALPFWAKVALAWLVLDLAIWAQHVAMHKIGWLWRLHRVHHSDTTMDVFTAFRFHPLELLVSLGWKALVIVALGAPPEAVLLFEIGLSAAAMLNHANVAIPPGIDRIVSRVLATPGFHLVHHHPDRHWTDSNFGNVLSIWDHLSGFVRTPPTGPASVGIDGVAHDDRAIVLLLQPFR